MQPANSKWTGDMPLGLGFFALAVLVGVIGVWSVNTRIAGAIIAPGIIQVESKRQIVQHPDGGVVKDILAKDGDTVRAGDILLKLDATFLTSELTIIEDQLYNSVARRARLEAERDDRDALNLSRFQPDFIDTGSYRFTEILNGQTRLFAARRTSLSDELRLIQEQENRLLEQIKGNTLQLKALKTQLSLARNDREIANDLSQKGLIPTTRRQSLRREEAQLQGSIGQLAANTAQIYGEIAQLAVQRSRLASARREATITELRALLAQQSELMTRRLSLKERLARLNIRAPAGGTVFGSSVFAHHSVIRPADPLMYIIPQDQPLLVVARVPPIHIDQLFLGQQASLRLTALDQRRTPDLFGVVTKISADLVTDDRTGENFYQIEITPSPEEFRKLGPHTLLPGMPADTYIKTSERTPLNYLAKPFLDYLEKALKDG